jgi:DNA polymerase-3 subunit gamma/tau
MRDGLSLLDQLIAFGGGVASEAHARAMLGTIDRGHVSRLVDALGTGDGPRLLAEARQLDQNVPDYDRALTELAAFLQRIAIVQIVPEAAAQDEEFEADELKRLAALITPEDAQLYYQIALNGRRDLSMAPEPRVGFEMTLLRMLAFRPDAGPPLAAAGTAAPRSVGVGGTTAGAAAASPAPAPLPAAARVTSVAAAPLAAAAIDAANWPAVLESAALSGMVRQYALNCVPAGFENDVLTLRMDAAVADRRTRAIDEKLIQGLSKYMGREIRVLFETAAEIASPARQRLLAEQDRAARAASAFESDPAVKGLRERFGADVDADSVKPVN